MPLWKSRFCIGIFLKNRCLWRHLVICKPGNFGYMEETKMRMIIRGLGMLALFGWMSGCTLMVDFSQKPSQSQCGNGKLEYGEKCDGDLVSAEIRCEEGTYPTCQPDCQNFTCVPNCGNGMLDDGEKCDGELLGAEVQCEEGTYPTCQPDCQNFECILTCGNGMLDDGEKCDGGMLSDEIRCEEGTYPVCQPDCQNFECLPNCGNGMLDEQEECDGFNMGNLSCLDGGFWGGMPNCNEECTADFGNCYQAVMLGTAEMDVAADIAVDRIGNRYVLGVTRSSNFLGEQPETGSVGADVVIVKWDRNGNRVWARRFSNFRADDQAVALAVDDDSQDPMGEPYVFGVANVRGTGNSGSTDATQNVYVFKMDSTGNVVEDELINTPDTPSADFATSLRLGANGVLYVTGKTDGRFDDENNQGGDDGFVVKMYRDNLGPIWTRMYGESGNDEIADCVEDSAGYLRILKTIFPLGDTNTVQIVTVAGSNGDVVNTGGYGVIPIPVGFTPVQNYGVSLDVDPVSKDVYVAVNYREVVDSPQFFALFRAGTSILHESRYVAQWPGMEARRVRFAGNGRVLVLGQSSGEINGMNPQGVTQVFLGVFDATNMTSMRFMMFDSPTVDTAAGLHPAGDAICMSATAGKPFTGMRTNETDWIKNTSDNYNIAGWCIPGNLP